MIWWSWVSIPFLGCRFISFANQWSWSFLLSGTVGSPDKQPNCYCCLSSITHRLSCVSQCLTLPPFPLNCVSFPNFRTNFVVVPNTASGLQLSAILGCSELPKPPATHWFKSTDCKQLVFLSDGFSSGDARCARLDGFFRLRWAVKKSFGDGGVLWVGGFLWFVWRVLLWVWWVLH